MDMMNRRRGAFQKRAAFLIDGPSSEVQLIQLIECLASGHRGSLECSSTEFEARIRARRLHALVMWNSAHIIYRRDIYAYVSHNIQKFSRSTSSPIVAANSSSRGPLFKIVVPSQAEPGS